MILFLWARGRRAGEGQAKSWRSSEAQGRERVSLAFCAADDRNMEYRLETLSRRNYRTGRCRHVAPSHPLSGSFGFSFLQDVSCTLIRVIMIACSIRSHPRTRSSLSFWPLCPPIFRRKEREVGWLSVCVAVYVRVYSVCV